MPKPVPLLASSFTLLEIQDKTYQYHLNQEIFSPLAPLAARQKSATFVADIPTYKYFPFAPAL